MIKRFALLLVLCLLTACATGSAETAETVEVALDGFTLSLQNGEYCLTYEKAVDQAYVIVWPFYSSGDFGQNYCFVWEGGPFEMTEDDALDRIADMEEELRGELGRQGFSLDSLSAEDIYEAELNGMPCVVADLELTISTVAGTRTVWEREIMFGSLGYIATITAVSADDLDAITDLMAFSLDFN